MKEKTKNGKKGKGKVCVGAVWWTTIKLRLRLCPWYFECVVMYARHEHSHLVGSGTEAELLVELLTGWTILLHGSPNSFDSVRELGRLIKVLLDKAALYLCY